MAVANGLGPPEMPERLKVSRSMIRSQLVPNFAKTQPRRQSELVALLIRVPVLRELYHVREQAGLIGRTIRA